MDYKLFKIATIIIGLCSCLFFTSCPGNIEVPEYHYTQPYLEWGISRESFLTQMESKGLTLIHEDNTSLFYTGLDTERLISYDFKNHKLVATTTFIECSSIEYSDVIKTFNGYEEKSTEGKNVYIDKSNDILGIINNITINNIEYYAIGWSQLNIPIANAVDLGLSVKWADVNLNISFPDNASSSPENTGNYLTGFYVWGDPTGLKSTSGGFLSVSEISGTEYDIAMQQWGDDWRTPTREEMSELLTLCNWSWQQLNGKDGYLVTGITGNSIFLPTTGYRDNNKWYDSEKGYYWTSALKNQFYPHALIFGLNFSGFNYIPNWGGLEYPTQSNGLAIRPVCD